MLLSVGLHVSVEAICWAYSYVYFSRERGYNMGLLHQDLTFELRRNMMEVQNEIGVGFDEETYHQGLIRRFTRAGLAFASKQRRQLMHRGSPLRTFELDFLAEDKVIVELKCLRCNFLRANYVQILQRD
ncbi:MAG: GxxExxY protein [bacterium]